MPFHPGFDSYLERFVGPVYTHVSQDIILTNQQSDESPQLTQSCKADTARDVASRHVRAMGIHKTRLSVVYHESIGLLH